MQLLWRAKVEHTGVVAGMSGSPVYFDGKLAGALSLKLGQFSKEPLAGITPIENILSLPKGQPGAIRAEAAPGTAPRSEQLDARFEIPSDWASRAGVSGGSFLTPIASPAYVLGIQCRGDPAIRERICRLWHGGDARRQHRRAARRRKHQAGRHGQRCAPRRRYVAECVVHGHGDRRRTRIRVRPSAVWIRIGYRCLWPVRVFSPRSARNSIQRKL